MTETAFVNCHLFDGKHDQVQDNAWFTTDESGQLTALGTGTAPTTATKTVDLGGQYVMPGLFNVHTHVTINPDSGDGDTKHDQTYLTVRALNNLHTLLKSGVTYVRGCGSTDDVDLALRKMQLAGKLSHVPHMMPSGRPFTMTGGHGDDGSGHCVDSQDEMRKGVRTALRDGAENVKVMATGGVMSPGDFMADPQLSVAEMREAVTEAHHKNHPVAAHAEGNPGIMNAIEAGVDSVEHGFYVNDEEAALMVKKNTYLVPTLVALWAIPTFTRGVLPDWEVDKAANALDDGFNNVGRAHQNGVKLALGTDAGTPHNDFAQTPKELELLTKVGLSNFEALQTSSVNAATLCRKAEHYGTLEVGKVADFLVLKANPLADVKAVQQADKQVYLNGQREF